MTELTLAIDISIETLMGPPPKYFIYKKQLRAVNSTYYLKSCKRTTGKAVTDKFIEL